MIKLPISYIFPDPGSGGSTGVGLNCDFLSTAIGGANARSKSLLSAAADGSASGSSGASVEPDIEGNIQIVGAIDCGERVLNIQHSENGAALSKLTEQFPTSIWSRFCAVILFSTNQQILFYLSWPMRVMNKIG